MRNLTHVGIGPAPAEGPGVVYLELRAADYCWNIPVTLDDLREIHALTGDGIPAWQAVKDMRAAVGVPSEPLMATHQGAPVDARDNIPKG